MRLRKVLRVDWAARAALPGRVRGRGCPKRVELDKLSPPGVWGPGTRRAREQTAQETRHFRVLRPSRVGSCDGDAWGRRPEPSDGFVRHKIVGVAALSCSALSIGSVQPVDASARGAAPTHRARDAWPLCERLQQCPRPPSGSWGAPTARRATIQGIGRATRPRGARASAQSRPRTSISR